MRLDDLLLAHHVPLPSPGVPFLYCHASHYISKKTPEPPTAWVIFMYALLLVGYYIWDTANSQKNRCC